MPQYKLDDENYLQMSEQWPHHPDSWTQGLNGLDDVKKAICKGKDIEDQV